MKPHRLSQIRWGEALAFLTIFIVGLVIFCIQLLTWAWPQLTLYQEFVPSRGIVFDKRITEQKFGTEIRYRPEVLLQHTVEDKIYRVWTFDYLTLQSPAGGFTPVRESAVSALEPFTVGRLTNCWFSVNQPEQAIVKWDISIWGWFLLFLSFSLIILGIIGLPQSIRSLAVSKERQAALALNHRVGTRNHPDESTIPDIRQINESPGTHLSYRLPMGHRPIFPLLGLTLLATVWTLIAFTLFFQSVLELYRGGTDQITELFFRGLFGIVGLMLYGVVVRQLWILFRVAPTLLELSDHPIVSNRKYRVLLHQNGIFQFEHLSVDLVCEEVARFHQGTDTITNRQDVFRQTLFSRLDFSTKPEFPLHEEFFLLIPEGAMHSFRGQNNEIVWKLELIANLKGWQELRRDCPIVVRKGLFSDLTMEGGV